MLSQRFLKVISSARFIYSGNFSSFHTTSQRAIDQKWREAQGLEENPNNFGPLTNLPDYSFIDGRPTPLGIRQKKRILKQREYAAKIVDLTKDINFAKERYKNIEREKKEKRQSVLDNKLMPKGRLLVQKK